MQPPSGGCVLKHLVNLKGRKSRMQPPSGGCVLKHIRQICFSCIICAATFGWLCVETGGKQLFSNALVAATFGWLCVETIHC